LCYQHLLPCCQQQQQHHKMLHCPCRQHQLHRANFRYMWYWPTPAPAGVGLWKGRKRGWGSGRRRRSEPMRWCRRSICAASVGRVFLHPRRRFAMPETGSGIREGLLPIWQAVDVVRQ
jgi:hypothetical protein